MPKPPKLSELDTSPRFTPTPAGAIKRQKPIWTREQFGPWVCDVAVTPITGTRPGYPLFEVLARWQHGPPLVGIGPRGGMAAADQYVIDAEAPDMRLTYADAQELAVELARRAADLLADGVKPDLALLVRAMLARRRA